MTDGAPRKARILAAMTDSRRPVPSKQTRPDEQPRTAPTDEAVAEPHSESRTSAQPGGDQWFELPESDGSTTERWVGLREAEELTGIPGSTIRNWARKRRIDSRFELDESGDRRYVELSEVVAWADHLGRQHRDVAGDAAISEEVEGSESQVASPEAVEDRGSQGTTPEDVDGGQPAVVSEVDVVLEDSPGQGPEAAAEETATADPLHSEVDDEVAVVLDETPPQATTTDSPPPGSPTAGEVEVLDPDTDRFHDESVTVDVALVQMEPAPETRDQALATRDSDRGASQKDVPAIPEGTMLVPLDAWNKMLNQLGNLHEAGQQLAAARERAAKAETEVLFLRERLADLRDRPTAEPPTSPQPTDATDDPPAPDPLWVDLYRRWNRRRRH